MWWDPTTWRVTSWNPTSIGIWVALINGTLIFIVANVRRRTLSLEQIGVSLESVLSSLNLWPSIYLFLFVADAQKRASLPPALVSYELYVALASILYLLITGFGLVSAYVKAWKV